MASVAELKEKHAAATASVNSLRERLRQRRQMLLDTDGEVPPPPTPPTPTGGGSSRGLGVNLAGFIFFADCFGVCVCVCAVERYSRTQGRTPVSFNPTDLVCCRTLQGHSGKVADQLTFCLSYLNFGTAFANWGSVVRFWRLNCGRRDG